MIKEIPRKVLEAFMSNANTDKNHSAGEIKAEPVNGGLINHTYKVNYEQQPGILLQQINKKVFSDPSQVQDNYINIWNHCTSGLKDLRLPSPIRCGEENTLFMDDNGNYWRAFEYIENSCMHPVAETPEQANFTAKAFAGFTSAFKNFDTRQLNEVIPGFHDLSLRFMQFEEAINGGLRERMKIASPIVEELMLRKEYKKFYDTIVDSGEFQQRVMHHDAKISNVLFNKVTNEVICLIDFDTVMPGYFFSDLGDMIRSMVCCENEDSDNFNNICVRKEFYDNIVAGYLDVIANQLTLSEKKHIHYSGLLMIYMQALRFLTDFLNGDIYYQTRYASHNFIRAKNQLILLQKLEEFLHKHYNFRHD